MKYPYRDPNTGRFANAIVRNLPKECEFVQYDYDCESIRSNHVIRQETESDYDLYFVIVGNGEYLAIWGMYGCVPTLTKPVYRLL